jgi:ketosteroid isomerase-like protein
MSRENVELARKAFDALNQGGVEALLVYLDPEIEWISTPGFLPDAENRFGHEGVKKWFEMLEEHFEDVRWEAKEFIDAGDRIMVAATTTARGKASGIPAELTLFHVVTVRDGKAVREESYLDRNQALEAAGLRE